VIYFTDPPWGLPQGNEDPVKELGFNGVFSVDHGEVSLVDSTLSWPNGIALSPDEHYLYVANVEIEEVDGEEQYDVFWMRYTLNEAGKPVGKEVFFRAPDTTLPGGPDGMTVDRDGNLFVTGPGGILVVNPDGDYLGTISLPLTPSNLTFGPREKRLFITAQSTLYRITME
jgi:gluconolactonase